MTPGALADLFPLDRILKIRQEFLRMGCAQLQDASRQHTHVLDLKIVPVTPVRQVAGPVFPVVTDNDMLPCLQALDAAPSGAVLFLHNTCERSDALAGDIFVTAAREQGLGGLVINGAVRDVDFLQNLGFPVFARDITYVSARTAQVPAAQLPCNVPLGDLLLEPGDWLFGDSDGLMVVKRRYLSAVFSGALVLRHREEELKAALLGGNRLGTLCCLDEFLAGRAKLKFDI